MSKIEEKKLFMLDMDGTIYHEDVLIPGAKELLNIIKEQKKNYIFMTNNSSKSKYSYVEKLQSLGIDASLDNIASSINATIAFLKRSKLNAKIYLVGTKSFQEELEMEGIIIVPIDYRHLDVDYVLVGFDTELNYNKIEGACFYLSRGVDFIATNCDMRCPVKGGKYIPDCGAICQLLESATQRQPMYLGKPDRYIVDSVINKWNVCADDIICVGDRLYTDIAVGINAGVDTAVVLTGESLKQDIFDTEFKPTYCYDSVLDIYNILKNNC